MPTYWLINLCCLFADFIRKSRNEISYTELDCKNFYFYYYIACVQPEEMVFPGQIILICCGKHRSENGSISEFETWLETSLRSSTQKFFCFDPICRSLPDVFHSKVLILCNCTILRHAMQEYNCAKSNLCCMPKSWLWVNSKWFSAYT